MRSSENNVPDCCDTTVEDTSINAQVHVTVNEKTINIISYTVCIKKKKTTTTTTTVKIMYLKGVCHAICYLLNAYT